MVSATISVRAVQKKEAFFMLAEQLEKISTTPYAGGDYVPQSLLIVGFYSYCTVFSLYDAVP